MLRLVNFVSASWEVGVVIAYGLLLIFPVAMIMAALTDLFTLKIPNRLSITLVAVFFPVALLAGLPLEAFLNHLATGAGILVVGFILFSLGTLGGGDAKLLAAAGLWMGAANLLDFFLAMAVLGGALAVTILLFRRIPQESLAGPAWALRLHDKGCGIPYGIAIAGAALFTFPATNLYALIAG
jgi:prepilin peptidase CpaA